MLLGLRSSWFKQKDIDANCFPEESTSTPPRPQGKFASSGQKEASVNKKRGTSQQGVTTLGRERQSGTLSYADPGR